MKARELVVLYFVWTSSLFGLYLFIRCLFRALNKPRTPEQPPAKREPQPPPFRPCDCDSCRGVNNVLRHAASQRGFGILLIELLIVAAILVTLSCLAIPNIIQMQRDGQQLAAMLQVRQVSRAEATLTLCLSQVNPTCTPSGSLTSLIPSPGSITTNGYVFTMVGTASGFTYTARPAATGTGQQVVSVDETAVVKCNGAPCH